MQHTRTSCGHQSCLRKTPSASRILAAFILFAVLWLGARPVHAQDPLTEAAVIRMARSNSPASATAAATDALARAQTRRAGLRMNPAVSWDRESVRSAPAGAQDIVRARVPLDFVRPSSRRDLAASRGARMRSQAAQQRNQAVLAALLAYYDVVLAQQRVVLLSQAVDNLDEAARVLARRELAGSTSGYASTRLSIARELAESHRLEAQGAVRATKARLGVLLEIDPDAMRIDASLTVGSIASKASFVRDAASKPDALRHARAAERLASKATSRAKLAWLPSLELGGGLKLANDFSGSTGLGYVLGLSLNIPIFDHGQALRAESEAQRMLSVARSQALVRAGQAQVSESYVVYQTARQELLRFESKTTTQVVALLRATQSGYEAGERTVIELLDAQRTQTEVAERQLALLGAAKRAEARLRAAAGGLQ